MENSGAQQKSSAALTTLSISVETEAHLREFAREGLRTLCFAQVEIDEDRYQVSAKDLVCWKVLGSVLIAAHILTHRDATSVAVSHFLLDADFLSKLLLHVFVRSSLSCFSLSGTIIFAQSTYLLESQGTGLGHDSSQTCDYAHQTQICKA